jgi:hypothetical protein
MLVGFLLPFVQTFFTSGLSNRKNEPSKLFVYEGHDWHPRRETCRALLFAMSK